MDRYSARINLHGSTPRERFSNNLKNTLNNTAKDNLSCKDVLINGVPQKLIIDSDTQTYYKKIKSLPNETFYGGDIIDWSDVKWIILNADADDEVYTDGKMQECTYLLKWQDKNGKIIERHIVSQNASAYNNGENGNKTLILGSDQLMLTLPFDIDTIKLRRGKRFFIDNNTINPTAYKLTRADTTSYVRNGKGCLKLIVTEDITSNDNDRPDLMLCDYISPTSPGGDVSGWLMEIEYLGNSTLKIGGNFKTFTAKLLDNNNNIVSITPVWTFDKYTNSFDIITTNNEIKIKTNDVNLGGEIITLTVTDSYSNISKSIQLTIVDL